LKLPQGVVSGLLFGLLLAVAPRGGVGVLSNDGSHLKALRVVGAFLVE
jgi:hypothetical protein